MELSLRATGCHLPYVITECYLSPNTSEHTTARGRYSIYLRGVGKSSTGLWRIKGGIKG